MGNASAPSGGRNIARLRAFVVRVAELVDSTSDERALLADAEALLVSLVSHDDWSPDTYAAPDPGRYPQYLLHCDSRERFSVVRFVRGPGQSTPSGHASTAIPKFWDGSSAA